MNGIEHLRYCIPCPARAVSVAHNAETAYFELPPGASHGIRLICKHPDCAKKQSRRPRFRYCAYCHSAVSYKNFRLRHSHLSETNLAKAGVGPSNGSSPNIAPVLLLKNSQQLNQQEREWLDLLREHPASLGYKADATKQWIDAVQAVTPVAFHNWMANVLMLPIGIANGSTENTPMHSVRGTPFQGKAVIDPTEFVDESLTSTTSDGYFSDF